MTTKTAQIRWRILYKVKIVENVKKLYRASLLRNGLFNDSIKKLIG